MNTRMMHILAGSAVILLLGATMPLASARAQSTAGDQSGTTPAQHKLPPTTHMPRSAAAQDRELDQIGNKLLKETPNKPVASTASEGGGLEPPTH